MVINAVAGGISYLLRQDHFAKQYRSRWWFLLPILFNIVGGIVAYYAIRNDDLDKAKNCLLCGILLFAAMFLPVVVIGGVSLAD